MLWKKCEPSFLPSCNESTVSNEPVASVKPENKETGKKIENKETGKVGRNKQKRKAEELVESEINTDSEDEEESSVDNSSGDDSDSSESTFGYCVGCDGPGPRGLVCNASGCEDANFVFE